MNKRKPEEIIEEIRRLLEEQNVLLERKRASDLPEFRERWEKIRKLLVEYRRASARD